MANPYFRFKQFTVYHDRSAMKVTTDACLFGAWCAGEMKNSKLKIENALDVGTGTGLLSLMVAQQNNLNIHAVEIDAGAATQAGENFAASPWNDRLEVTEGDITTTPLAPSYDCIISNPPFYENEWQSAQSLRNVAHHSHRLKLEELLDLIQQHLAEDGVFFLLLPFKRQAEIERLLKEKHLFAVKEVLVHQSTRHSPFRIMIKGSKNALLQKEEVHIKISFDNGSYTPEFTALLKDYYFYL